MDEYVGLSKDHPQSYHHFMWSNFFSQVGSPSEANATATRRRGCHDASTHTKHSFFGPSEHLLLFALPFLFIIFPPLPAD